MSVELSKKKHTTKNNGRKPHRKSHTEFDVKRNLHQFRAQRDDVEQHGLRRLPRKTLKDESLGFEFGDVSIKKGAPQSEKSVQFANNKRKPSVDMRTLNCNK
jgi:hypothetical protein